MKRHSKKNKTKNAESIGDVHTVSLNKKILIGVGALVGIMVLLGVFALIFSINKTKHKGTEGGKEELNAGAIINGDKGYISSAQIIQAKTGTGPWDANDEPGNDSSEDNNIVRSFDQITWTIDLTISADKVIVSAKGKYNIQLNRNDELANRTTVDYGEGATNGRMYGYSFAVQLYNEYDSKGLKGIEYPKGEISFDINLKLERTKFESQELEDITNECTPNLWQYGLNNWDSNYGNIPNRKYLEGSSYHKYDNDMSLGKFKDYDYTTYNSGDISIIQEGENLKVKIKDYKFNGIFPYYNSQWPGAVTERDRSKIYAENIGTFSVGYMQLFVPDKEASTVENRNYYLTVSDNNMSITSSTNEKITNQMKTSDDSKKVQHVLYKKGTYYQYIYNKNGELSSSTLGAGDARATLGEPFYINTKFYMSVTNDYDIYTANKFIKFDGEGIEPIYYEDGSKYKIVDMRGNVIFRIWYVTKKDGTNWKDQQEMNNGNIENMDIYDNIEDIPQDKICVGIYAESVSGYISRFSGSNNVLKIKLKVRETANIGKTYGLTQRTQV